MPQNNVNEKKLIIFDLDGTLVHYPFEYFFSETQRVFEKNNWGSYEKSLLEDCFSDFDYFRFIKDHPECELLQDQFWQEFDWTSYPKAVELEHTAEALEKLAMNSYLMAIATARSSTLEDLHLDLSRLTIKSHFSAFHVRESKEHDWKDKSPQIQRVLRELNVLPENAILVGDTPSDVESARRASLRGSIAVLTGGIKESILQNSKPDKIISTLSEIQDALKFLDF